MSTTDLILFGDGPVQELDDLEAQARREFRDAVLAVRARMKRKGAWAARGGVREPYGHNIRAAVCDHCCGGDCTLCIDRFTSDGEVYWRMMQEVVAQLGVREAARLFDRDPDIWDWNHSTTETWPMTETPNPNDATAAEVLAIVSPLMPEQGTLELVMLDSVHADSLTDGEAVKQITDCCTRAEEAAARAATMFEELLAKAREHGAHFRALREAVATDTRLARSEIAQCGDMDAWDCQRYWDEIVAATRPDQ
jgi:hypothetical protein